MNPLDSLRRLPLEIEPPRGVRERARQRLLASLSMSLAPMPIDDVVRRSAPIPLVAQPAGVKLAFLALGSGVIGASLAFWAPRFIDALHGAAERRATEQAPVASSPMLPPATLAPIATTADGVRTLGLPLVEAVPASARRTQANSTRSPNKSATTLAEERALLDTAREQLSMGHTVQAFQLTEAHLARFTKGKLAEEREALAIAALAKLGERERASRRAERFRQSYPNSFLAQAIETALGEAQ